MPACVSRGPSFQSLGVLSLFLRCWWSRPVQSAPTGPASVSSGDLGPFPFTFPGLSFPICEMGEELGEDGIQRARGPPDRTTLPNSPGREMVHTDRHAGHRQRPTDRHVFCCHTRRVPPEALRGICSCQLSGPSQAIQQRRQRGPTCRLRTSGTSVKEAMAAKGLSRGRRSALQRELPDRGELVAGTGAYEARSQ